jgi:hypothetical protein
LASLPMRGVLRRHEVVEVSHNIPGIPRRTPQPGDGSPRFYLRPRNSYPSDEAFLLIAILLVAVYCTCASPARKVAAVHRRSGYYSRTVWSGTVL